MDIDSDSSSTISDLGRDLNLEEDEIGTDLPNTETKTERIHVLSSFKFINYYAIRSVCLSETYINCDTEHLCLACFYNKVMTRNYNFRTKYVTRHRTGPISEFSEYGLHCTVCKDSLYQLTLTDFCSQCNKFEQ